MDKPLIIAEIEQVHQSVIDVINNSFKCLILSVENQKDGQTVTSNEYVVPLSSDPSIFINKKPSAVLFGDTRIEAANWTQVFCTVLNQCCQNPVYHSKVMDLRGKASKAKRYISKSEKGMRRPIKISEDLYVEINYGSQTLMNILVKRILAPIGYDYSNISIVLRMSK
jgi:hypothetical protein